MRGGSEGGAAPRGGRGAGSIYFPLFLTGDFLAAFFAGLRAGAFFFTGFLAACFFAGAFFFAGFLAACFFTGAFFFTTFLAVFFFAGAGFLAAAFLLAFGFGGLGAGGGGGGGGGGGTRTGVIGMGSIQPAPDQPISIALIGSSSACWCDAPRRRTARTART